MCKVQVDVYKRQIFAFVNAQVRLVGVDLVQLALDPVAMGTYFGMLLGKPLGIVGVTFLLVRSGIADMPKNVTGAHILGVGILGGCLLYTSRCV